MGAQVLYLNRYFALCLNLKCYRNNQKIVDHLADYGQQKICDSDGAFGDLSNHLRIRLKYDRAIHSIQGSDVQECFGSDKRTFKDTFREVKQSIEERQGKKGFTIILNSMNPSSIYYYHEIMAVFQEADDQPPFFYLQWPEPIDNLKQMLPKKGSDELFIFPASNQKQGKRNATEVEMRTWLKERGNRSLVTDPFLAAGWEDSTVIAIIDLYGQSLSDNMCLRAVSSLHVIKVKKMTTRVLEQIFFPWSQTMFPFSI